MTERQSDGVSGNGGNGRNVGKFWEGWNEIWVGFNGKGMEWNMVHDKGRKMKVAKQTTNGKINIAK